MNQRVISRKECLNWATAAAAMLAIPTRVAAQSGFKIRMGAALGDTLAEPYYGVSSEIFQRAGLDVDATPFSGGSALMTACVASTIEVGVGDVIQITHAVNAGVPFAIFAASALYSSDAPFTVLATSKDGQVYSAKDLEGKAVAVNSLNSLPEYCTREWMQRSGADSSTLKFVEMNGMTMMNAVLTDAVAAGVPGEPFITLEKSKLRVLAKPFDMIAKAFPLTYFYAHRGWLSANADVARRLTQAVYDTARWASTHMMETAPILAKYTKIEVTVVEKMNRAHFATSLAPSMLQPMIDIETKYKAVRQPVAAADLIMDVT